MIVNSREQAWKEANKLMPTDYEKDEARSQNAGYPIYWSTNPETIAWISDLNCRLEVNLPDGKSVNIWIETYSGFIVEVYTLGTREKRTFTYNEFASLARFFWSGGERFENGFEDLFEGIMNRMNDFRNTMDVRSMDVSTVRNGLEIHFRFKEDKA